MGYEVEHQGYAQPYLRFDHGGDRLSIVHRAPAGNLLRWVVMVERVNAIQEAIA